MATEVKAEAPTMATLRAIPAVGLVEQEMAAKAVVPAEGILEEEVEGPPRR